MTNFVSYANATELMTEIGNKFKAVNGAYVFRGSSTFANLPSTLTKAMTGYTYNLSEDFTTDARFIEGAGKKYSAGTNVSVANVGTADEPVMKFDVNSAFVNVDKIYGTIAGVFSTETAYAIGDVVIYDGDLYKFKAAHTVGAWDATQVDKTTVEALIAAAEPESLTTEQMTALLALLE